MRPSILFFGKKGDFYSDRAIEFIEAVFHESLVYSGTRSDPLPSIDESIQFDYIISYLSPWIIPESLLTRAKRGCINFHPGPPEYPGIGCTNFAIYDESELFGVTCHHMLSKVDTGDIIGVRRFQLFPEDSVYSLTQRCYAYILELFYETLKCIANNEELPKADEHWKRVPYTRSELNALCEITLDMSEDEVKKRVRAVTFPNAPGAYIEKYGYSFKL